MYLFALTKKTYASLPYKGVLETDFFLNAQTVQSSNLIKQLDWANFTADSEYFALYRNCH